MATTQRTDTPDQVARIEPEPSRAPGPEIVGPPVLEGTQTVVGPAAGHGEAGSADARGPRPASGARLLVADARTALLLINHARRQAVMRTLGVSPEQANLVTAIGLLLLADAAREKLGRLLQSPGAPSPGDGLLAVGSARALVGAVAGPVVDETPGLGTLVTIAFVGHAARPAAVSALRALRAGTQRLDLGFHHRYGYLVDPGHWRAQRARRREARQARPGSPPRNPAEQGISP